MLAVARLGGGTVGSWARATAKTWKPRGAVLPYGNAGSHYSGAEQTAWKQASIHGAEARAPGGSSSLEHRAAGTPPWLPEGEEKVLEVCVSLVEIPVVGQQQGKAV